MARKIKPGHEEFTAVILMDLMREAVNAGYTMIDLADAVTVDGSPRTFENYRTAMGIPTLAGFMGLLRTVRSRAVMEELARQCGGYFIKPPKCQDHPFTTIVKHTAAIMKETADVVTAASETLSDGKVTPLEKKRLVREINEAVEALLSARISLERDDAS